MQHTFASNQAEGQVSMAEPAFEQANTSARILVVEDDPMICRLYENALGKKGYQVRIACSFHEAKEFLRTRSFDVIITDIFLDEEDGLSLLASSQSQYPDTPVILITGRPTIETASAAVRLHAYEYLVKPISLEVLSDAIKRAVAFKTHKADRKKLELEKRRYQRDLEHLVAKRTEKLIQTYQEYQEQSIFLSNVIESLAHPFMVIDTRDYGVKVANSAARKNQPHQDATCYRLNHGFDKPCSQLGHRCPVEEVVRSRDAVSLEHVHQDSGGKTTEFEVHAFPLFNDAGEVAQVIQYCIDITEKKRLEAVAEAANLMDNLGYIFSGIRHEIGNPLNSVKMALSVLDKNLDRYPRETIREFVGRSLGELSRVEYLLKALKNYSMFETPKMENIHLGRFMDNFMSLVEEDFSRKGIHIFLDMAEEDIYAFTDDRAFHQVMLNVLTNAADALYREDRPMIDIMVDTIPGFVRINVRDNGCGMTQEEQKNLFRPFFTSKPQGTGLGLVIVKKMVSKMNGTITIESSPLEGTRVTIMLPEGHPYEDEES
jgi:signal transduction histidine kinase/DNA-binding response OmpR family regulator